jgi:hypothetical protein
MEFEMFEIVVNHVTLSLGCWVNVEILKKILWIHKIVGSFAIIQNSMGIKNANRSKVNQINLFLIAISWSNAFSCSFCISR